MEGLEGHTGLPALQPVPCPFRSWMGSVYISIPDLLGVVLLGAVLLSHCPATHYWPLSQRVTEAIHEGASGKFMIEPSCHFTTHSVMQAVVTVLSLWNCNCKALGLPE